MHRFFVEPEQIGPDHARIVGGDVNHIRNVLRMVPGDLISVSDGRGTEYICEIETLEQEMVTARILERKPMDVELSSPLVLYQGLPKGDKMEWIIQKAVELGAVRIVPVSLKRCVVKLDAKKAEAKRRRWQAVAESAAKQSGRSVIPQVESVQSLSEALQDAQDLDVRILPYECARGMDEAREVLDQIQRGQSVGVFIGPEGGFEKAEVEEAVAAGARPVSLGRRILRTETAGICILSVLMFRLED